MQACGVVNDHSRPATSRTTCSGSIDATSKVRLMLDERVRSVLERLQAEDADERERGLPAAERSRAVARTTGQFLFALVSPQLDCEVLEIGGSRGYSTIWLAAGVRSLGGRVLSLEHDPAKVEAWRANIAEAGLDEWAELVEGDAAETIPGDRRRVRRRLPRRREGGLRAALPGGPRKARAGRPGRRRQRALARGDARRVRRGPARTTPPSSR